ncbi:MAG: sarcosine oxidase subunit gamma [Desulfobulbia bacterium]
MSEFALTRKTGLGLSAPMIENWDGFSIEEIEDENKFWISTHSNQQKLNTALKKAVSCELPEKGHFSDGGTSRKPWRIVAAGPGQWLLTGTAASVPPAVQKLAAITELSDGWVGWRLSGEKVRQVFEKLIGLDLHPNSFPGGSSARTSIEGIAAILICEDADAGKFVLYSQRSYARDFVEHIRQAAYSSCGERLTSGVDEE